MFLQIQFRHLLSLTFTLFALIFPGSCTYDVGVAPVDKYNIDIGSFELLDESITQFPYQNKTLAVYRDTVGNEVLFRVSEALHEPARSTLIRYNVYLPGDTVRYSYDYEYRHAGLYCEELDVRFTVNLKAEPYHPDPTTEYVADVLNVFIYNQGSTTKSTQVFWHVLDQRTWPEVFSATSNIASLNVFDQVFQNVFVTNISNPISKVYFNYDVGIVSFTDHAGKRWRFDRFS